MDSSPKNWHLLPKTGSYDNDPNNFGKQGEIHTVQYIKDMILNKYQEINVISCGKFKTHWVAEVTERKILVIIQKTGKHCPHNIIMINIRADSRTEITVCEGHVELLEIKSTYKNEGDDNGKAEASQSQIYLIQNYENYKGARVVNALDNPVITNIQQSVGIEQNKIDFCK